MNQRVSDDPSNSAGADGHGTQSTVADSAPLAVSYIRPATGRPEAGTPLAQISFGPPGLGAGLNINVELPPVAVSPAGARSIEVWEAHGAVEKGEEASIRFARDGRYQFATIEVEESRHGGVLGAAEFAYAEVHRFQQQSPYRHVLRMWNYIDAVNEGLGDMERYRQFCVGRARGLGDSLAESYPAASAVGRQRPAKSLLVYWLSGHIAGHAVENPRQVSAYRYPQTYGPVSPSFSRATIAPDNTLLISGTASILGHASHHVGDVIAQLDETLRNLDALIAQAARHRYGLLATLAPRTSLKVYVRNPQQVAAIDSHLRMRLPGITAIYLAADICRSELLLEIECVQTAAAESAG